MDLGGLYSHIKEETLCLVPGYHAMPGGNEQLAAIVVAQLFLVLALIR